MAAQTILFRRPAFPLMDLFFDDDFRGIDSGSLSLGG